MQQIIEICRDDMSVKLGSICKFQSGGTPSKSKEEYFGGNVPWITTTALNGALIGEDDAIDWITDKAISETAAKIVPANSIMVGTRVGVGKTAVNSIPMSTSQDIISLIGIDEGVWSKDFLCKFIQSRSAYLNSQARGATIKGIKIDVLASLEVPEIELDVQKKISGIIDKVKGIKADREKETELLDELIKVRFVELFGNPVINDKGWNTDSCKNLMSKIGSGATPKGGRESYCDEGISLIRSMNVYNNRFEYKDLAHITDEQAKQLDNVTIEKSDVLLNITGASVARCCVVPDDLLPARVNQHVSIIRCKESLLPEFVCSMFTEDNYC